MSRKRKFEWVFNGKFHEQVPITEADMGSNKKKRQRRQQRGTGYGPFSSASADIREFALDFLKEEDEPSLERPNINIRRDDVMRAIENMLDKYTPKSAYSLRKEFVERLDEVVDAYAGERALNQLARRGLQRGTVRT